MDVGQVDLNHCGVFGIGVALEQLGIFQPGFLGCDTAPQGTGIGVTIGNHPLHHGDVAGNVFLNWLLVQVHGATSSRTFRGSVRQLKRLLHFQIRQPLDLQNAAREDVLLALLLDGQQTGLDGVEGNRIHQITQGDAVLHFALEAHQHGFGHVQRHHASGSSKRHQAGTSGETDADRETGVAVATGADGVGQQHAVEPAVNHAVARAQGHTAAGADEVGQLVVHLHVHWLGVSGRMAEGLHHQVRAEAQTSQVFQLVAGHRAGGVLRADRRHLGLAVGTRQYALAFWQTTGTAHHLLCQRKTLAVALRNSRQAEQCGRWQPQGFTGFGSQATANDEGDTTTSTHFVKQHVALDLKGSDFLAILEGLAVVWAQFDHVTHVHLIHIQFDGQSAGIFHGVVENRSYLGAQANTTKTLVWHKWNVFTGEPQH